MLAKSLGRLVKEGKWKWERKPCWVSYLWFFTNAPGTAAQVHRFCKPHGDYSPWGDTMSRGLYPAINVPSEHPDQEKWSLRGGKCCPCQQAGLEPIAIDPKHLPSSRHLWEPLSLSSQDKAEQERNDPISNLFDCESLCWFFFFLVLCLFIFFKYVLFQTQNFSHSFSMWEKKKKTNISESSDHF